MRRRVQRLTAPAELPVSLAHAKAHLRVTHARDDAYIAELVAAAASHIEAVTSRQLLTVRVRVTYPCFAPKIPLDFCAVGDVYSLRYTDATGADVAVPATDFRVLRGVTTDIVPEVGKSWPATHPLETAVHVELDAQGFGERWEDVPESLRHAVLLLIGHWYSNREAVTVGVTAMEMPMAVEALIAPWRVLGIG